jgi:hypothetical protein
MWIADQNKRQMPEGLNNFLLLFDLFNIFYHQNSPFQNLSNPWAAVRYLLIIVSAFYIFFYLYCKTFSKVSLVILRSHEPFSKYFL